MDDEQNPNALGVTLALTSEEQALLREVLDEVLSDLREETVGTDNPAYRRNLHERRDLLIGIAERLPGS